MPMSEQQSKNNRSEALDSRLQALLDKQEISELIYQYCNAADRHDHALMRSLYHEDAIDDHGSFFNGLAMDFIDQLPAIQEPMLILQHNITNLQIRLDGDYAEAEVYVIAFHQVKTDEGAQDLIIGGRYFDKYERRDGRWKFSHKSVVADWARVDQPSRVCLDHPMLEGSYFGRPGPDDPSYKFFRLFKFGDEVY